MFPRYEAEFNVNVNGGVSRAPGFFDGIDRRQPMSAVRIAV